MPQILDFNNALREKELEAFLARDDAPDKDKVLAGLAQEVEQFAAWLFPSAIVTRSQILVGDVYGSPGTSLKIETKGAKRGLWKDFADPSQKGGDLIGLYMAARGVAFPQALQDLSEWVGKGQRPEVNYQRAQLVRKLKKVERDLGPPVGSWHYTDAEGSIVATVYRFEPEPGSKEFLPWDAVKRRYGNPDIRPLYNIPGILRSPSVVFVEGEKAAQSLIDRGIEATCVMGGSNSPLDRTDLTPLQGKKVTIWPDADEPGRKFAAGLASALRDIASSVEFVEPPEDAPQGWDAADTDEPGRYLGEALAPTAQQLAPLPLEWAGEAKPVIDGFWLIDDWLPSSGIAAVYGHPGSGKSFLALHMAAHIASGKEWAGRHVERGLVVYVVAEGATGFRNRMYAMRENGEIAPDAPLAYIATPIDMQAEDGDVQALIQTIRVATEAKGVRPAMIVLDTLSKTFGAGKENTDDMVNYVNNCQRVASAFECLTLVVHHRPKDQESRDLRGHSSLRGNVDTTILVEAGDIKTATTLKQKDGEDNVQVRFKLIPVPIGEDKRGKIVTTCLVEITDEEPRHSITEGLNKSETAAIMGLIRLIEEQQIDPETGEISDCPGLVCSEAWKEALRTGRTISADNFETAGRQFRRIRSALEKKGKIEMQGTYVMLARTGADN
jgi:KaiC/GvpD/RAD55 family RecA-like ATPase